MPVFIVCSTPAAGDVGTLAELAALSIASGVFTSIVFRVDGVDISDPLRSNG
jgi:hypothetical protein